MLSIKMRNAFLCEGVMSGLNIGLSIGGTVLLLGDKSDALKRYRASEHSKVYNALDHWFG
jgi:hypothetical protein